MKALCFNVKGFICLKSVWLCGPATLPGLEEKLNRVKLTFRRDQIRRKFDMEFKLMAVNLCFSGKATREVAADLGISVDPPN